MGRTRCTALVLAAAGLALPLGACGGDPGTPTVEATRVKVTAAASGATRVPLLITRAPTAPPQPGGPRTRPPKPPPTGDRLVTLRRSGGLAGVAQTVIVTANGAWTFDDVRRGDQRRTGRLSEGQRRQLDSLLARPALAKEARVARRQPAKCQGGHTYSLVTGDVTVRWSDCGQAGEPATAASIAGLLELWTPMAGGL